MVPLHDLTRWLQLQSAADRRVLAHGWRLANDLTPAEMAQAMLDSERVGSVLERLQAHERSALTAILAAGGTLPVAIMEREHGNVRDPAAFPDPRSYLSALLSPPSPTERLFLLGLIIRDHDDRGLIFRVQPALVPLLPVVPMIRKGLQVQPQPDPVIIEAGTAAAVEQCILVLLTLAYDGQLQALDDGALNKASVIRYGRALQPPVDLRAARREADWPWLVYVRTLAQSAGFVRRTADGSLAVAPAALTWLQLSAAERVTQLLTAWRVSRFDELALLGNLRWRGQPFNLRMPDSRQALLDLYATIPDGDWIALDDLVQAVHDVQPYFLRRDGRFNSWLLYDQDGQSMAGEEHWLAVEGVFIRMVTVCSLFWLGLVDLGYDDAAATNLRVRWTPMGRHVWGGAPQPAEPPVEPIVVQSTFELLCPPNVSLYARFQLSRIAEHVRTDEVTIFRLTRKSVLRAVERGVSGADMLEFLRTVSGAAVPPAVAYRLSEWSSQADQIAIESATLLKADPMLIGELRRMRNLQLPPLEELRPDLYRINDGDAPDLVGRLKNAGFGVVASLVEPQSAVSPHDLKLLVTAAVAYAQACAELDLPCDITPTLLGRIRKLIPRKQALAADQAANELRQRIVTEREQRVDPVHDAKR